MAEFTNHLILKMDEELPDQLAVLFFDVVNTIGPDDIVQTMEDSVMLHYVQDNIHNYEVNLTIEDISDESTTEPTFHDKVQLQKKYHIQLDGLIIGYKIMIILKWIKWIMER